MKRVQLIEYGIVIIGLIFGYKAFDSFFGAMTQVLYSFGGMGNIEFEYLLPTLLILAAYTTCFIILIRKSRSIAVYLASNAASEDVPFKIGKRSLLQVVLIGICAITILVNLAEILLYLYESFRNEAGRRNLSYDESNTPRSLSFKLAAIRSIIAGVVLYFSKDISNWFIRKNEADELTFDSTPEQ